MTHFALYWAIGCFLELRLLGRDSARMLMDLAGVTPVVMTCLILLVALSWPLWLLLIVAGWWNDDGPWRG